MRSVAKTLLNKRDATVVNGFKRLSQTFETAEKAHPDLMEPYSVRLGEATDDAHERMEIMRAGLRETFRRRYPMPEGFYDRKVAAA